MRMKARWRFAVPVGAALLVAASVLNFAPLAGAQTATGGAAVEGLKGFSTGQDLHATVLEAAPTRVVNADEAWTGASVDAGQAGLAGTKLDEENRIFQPSKPGKLSYARASGVEVGLGTTPTDPNQVVLAAFTDAAAPPPSSKDTDLLGPLSVPPLAYASATRGIAVANGNESGLEPDVCVIGDDLSRGKGYAADAQLVDTGTGGGPGGQLNTPLIGTDAPNGSSRAVAQTISHEFLVPSGQGGDNFGLASEVRETIAPVSVLANEKTGVETLTIEVLGEWVLRAVATGHEGGASVFYGPGTVNPETPVLRILPSSGNPTVLKLQDLLGNTGLDIPADPLIHVTLGEAPRALAKPGAAPAYGSSPSVDKANGMFASAAVDVLRVQSQALGIDIRLGHMEVSANSPKGGVDCPIPVTKTADPSEIKIGETPDTSHVTITVHNAFLCDLKDTVLTDTINKKPETGGDPNFEITSADPSTTPADAVPTGVVQQATLKWDLGTIPRGQTKSVTLDLKSATSGGIIEDIGHADATLTNCQGGADSGVAVNGLAINNLRLAGLSVPVDVNVEIPRTGPNSRNTLATGAGLLGLALAGGFLMRRRRGTATP